MSRVSLYNPCYSSWKETHRTNAYKGNHAVSVCLPAYLSLRPIAHPPAVSIGRPMARLWSNWYQRFCQVAVFIRIDIISLYFYKAVNGAPRNIRNVTMKDCICKVCDKLARTRVSLFSRERGWYHRVCVCVCERERESPCGSIWPPYNFRAKWLIESSTRSYGIFAFITAE
jgi:hypothetical protein